MIIGYILLAVYLASAAAVLISSVTVVYDADISIKESLIAFFSIIAPVYNTILAITILMSGPLTAVTPASRLDLVNRQLAYAAMMHGASLSEDKDMLRHWHPEKDLGTAMALAAALQLDVRHEGHKVIVGRSLSPTAHAVGIVPWSGGRDKILQATIFEAAVQIGTKMKLERA